MRALSHLRRVTALGAWVVLVGCASGPLAQANDPLEPFNRKVYAFNEQLDDAVAKPVATAYRDVVPSPVRTGVSNFFGNLGDLWSSFNALLQAKGEESVTNFMRFTVNSTLGLYGLLDIASEMRMQRTSHSLGETLGVWGVPNGPYLVLPVFGPSTVRNTGAAIASGAIVDEDQRVKWLHVNESSTPLNMLNITHDRTQTSLGLLGAVNQRANLLGVTDALGGLALDPYAFVRDAYLQRENNKIKQNQ
jgi:phospholipid-binding lipoprotein MlaA